MVRHDSVGVDVYGEDLGQDEQPAFDPAASVVEVFAGVGIFAAEPGLAYAAVEEVVEAALLTVDQFASGSRHGGIVSRPRWYGYRRAPPRGARHCRPSAWPIAPPARPPASRRPNWIALSLWRHAHPANALNTPPTPMSVQKIWVSRFPSPDFLRSTPDGRLWVSRRDGCPDEMGVRWVSRFSSRDGCPHLQSGCPHLQS